MPLLHFGWAWRLFLYIHNLYCLQNNIRVMKSMRMRRVDMRVREIYTKFSQKTWREKRPFGRPVRLWEDNNEMDFEEMGCESLDFIWLTLGMILWKAFVGKILNIQVSYKAGFFFTRRQSTYSWVGPCSSELLVVRLIIRQMGVNRIRLRLTVKLLCAIINSLYRNHM
jgi:hypothetical protein